MINRRLIIQIKAELKTMYPLFNFDFIYNQNDNVYYLNVFNGIEQLGSMTLEPTIPMVNFWVDVKKFVTPMLVDYGT